MAATILSPKQLSGVYEKLKRADETIQNLNSEIIAFQKERPKGGLSKDKQKASAQLVEFNSKREVPLRFGVITGEIVHHLRSSLDHIAWALSSDEYRLAHPRYIGFPVAMTEPLKKDEIASYGRQIKGIASPNAVRLIQELQPYTAPNPTDDPLAILHEFNREDKHHTLVLVVSRWEVGLTIPLRLFTTTMIRSDVDPKLYAPTPADKLKLEFSFAIAFPQFGKRENQPVIPSLTELANKTSVIIKRFSQLRD
jgi:hypothetical protein